MVSEKEDTYNRRICLSNTKKAAGALCRNNME
jgi:hypothetical protein